MEGQTDLGGGRRHGTFGGGEQRACGQSRTRLPVEAYFDFDGMDSEEQEPADLSEKEENRKVK